MKSAARPSSSTTAEANPFLDSQLVICSSRFLAGDPARAAQALAAGWDLLVVDEAHHLEWSREHASPQYALVEALARQTAGVLLLTATPQQLGPEGHFARLRLLDPDRYADLARFLEEAAHYEEVAQAVDRLLEGQPLTQGRQARLRRQIRRACGAHCDELTKGDETARARLIAALLDEFGIGRVMFRNTRAALSGFPERRRFSCRWSRERKAGPTPTKVKLARRAAEEARRTRKVLLICRTRELVEEISDAPAGRDECLAPRFFTKASRSCSATAMRPSLPRKRARASSLLGDRQRRAQLSVRASSRAFRSAGRSGAARAAHRPARPHRADGDDRDPRAVSARHRSPKCSRAGITRGSNAFEKNPHGAAEIAQTPGERPRRAAARNSTPRSSKRFIARTREHMRGRVAKKLERGHDRLLELNSCKPERAAELIAQSAPPMRDEKFEEFFVRLLDHFGVQVEDLGRRAYILRPGHLITDAFPALPEEGMSVTFDRAQALSREDLGFLSADHPMIRSALDLLLGAEAGNAAFGIWKAPGTEAILLEVASPWWNASRRPRCTSIVSCRPRPIRVRGRSRAGRSHAGRSARRGAAGERRHLPPARSRRGEEEAAARDAREDPGARRGAMQTLVERRGRHECAAPGRDRPAGSSARINDHIRPEEIEALRRQQLAALTEAPHLRPPTHRRPAPHLPAALTLKISFGYVGRKFTVS